MAERSKAPDSPLDYIFRRSLGATGDYSGALFGGDFSLSLTETQRHNGENMSVVSALGLGEGDRVIDLGCGWGGLLAYARSRGSSAASA